MATILPFVPPPGSGHISRGAPEGGAALVIFPGVRYERRPQLDPSPGSAQGAAGADKRKRRTK